MYDVVLQRPAASPQCHAATHRSVALLLTAASSAANHSSVTLLLTATFTRARRRGCASPHSPDGARSAIFSPVRRRGRWHSARNVASIQLERPTGKAAVAHVVRAHCSGPLASRRAPLEILAPSQAFPWRSWHPAKPSCPGLGPLPCLLRHRDHGLCYTAARCACQATNTMVTLPVCMDCRGSSDTASQIGDVVVAAA